MKLPADSTITESKLTGYLLQRRSEDDKARFLSMAGYSPGNWRRLEEDIRRVLVEGNAHLVRVSRHGEMYHVVGRLTGPNGLALDVTTVWVRLHATGETRFVTPVPAKGARP